MPHKATALGVTARDAAFKDIRSAEYSDQLGLLRLAGHLTEPQYAAGRHFATLAADYNTAMGSPKQPRSACFDTTAGQPADPDSAIGKSEAARHRGIVARYNAARDVLRRVGSLGIIDAVVMADSMPTTATELRALREGLTELASHFARS